MSESEPLRPARQPRIPLTRKLLYSCLITGSLCLALEYLLRWVLDDNSTEATAESLHTEYDPQIGWINKADFFAADLYGADKHLRTLSSDDRVSAWPRWDTNLRGMLCGAMERRGWLLHQVSC